MRDALVALVVWSAIGIGCCEEPVTADIEDAHAACLNAGGFWVRLTPPDAGPGKPYCTDGRSGLIQVERLP